MGIKETDAPHVGGGATDATQMCHPGRICDQRLPPPLPMHRSVHHPAPVVKCDEGAWAAVAEAPPTRVSPCIATGTRLRQRLEAVLPFSVTHSDHLRV